MYYRRPDVDEHVHTGPVRLKKQDLAGAPFSQTSRNLLVGPVGISCWGPNASVHRGDFAAESSFTRNVQSQSAEAAF